MGYHYDDFKVIGIEEAFSQLAAKAKGFDGREILLRFDG